MKEACRADDEADDKKETPIPIHQQPFGNRSRKKEEADKLPN